MTNIWTRLGMTKAQYKHDAHKWDREAKRDEARDRARRNTQVSDDLLRDGMEEIVFARLEGDAPAKLAMDCEAVDFEVERNESDLAVQRLRERLTYGTDVPELSVTENYGSPYYDPEDDFDYPSDEEIDEARAALVDEDDDHYWPESDAIWPPVATIHDIEESHLFRDRGFIITDTPWGAKR